MPLIAMPCLKPPTSDEIVVFDDIFCGGVWASLVTGPRIQRAMILGISIFVAGCNYFPEKKQNFQVCVSGQSEKSECKELLDVTIKRPLWKMGGPGGGRYYSGDPDYLAVSIPGDERMMERSPYPYEVVIHFRGGETMEQYFALWLDISTRAGGHCSVNQPAGSLWAISQICMFEGRRLESPIATDYVPASANNELLQSCIRTFEAATVYESTAFVKKGACGAPVAWFNCSEPRGTITKNPMTKNGCRVHAVLRPHVFVEYSIYYRHLQDWRSIHEEVLHQLNEVMTIQEKGVDHGQ